LDDGQDATLRLSLERVQSLYEIPQDDLVGEVLIPALSVAENVDISVGFFSSRSLAAIAPGLSSLVSRGVRCRLLLSPEISEGDREAIELGISTPEEVLANFVESRLAEPTGHLANYAFDILAFLVAKGTLDVRCVLMERGMFHKKVWLMEAADETVAVHGSGNMTERGMFVNGEQMTVDCSWDAGPQIEERLRRLRAAFDAEWANERPDFLVIESHQMVQLLRERAKTLEAPPTIEDFWAAWQREYGSGTQPALPPGVISAPGVKRLAIPAGIDWRNPPFAHQAKAIEALETASGVGLLAIATGGGKTKISLIATTRIQDRIGKPLLCLVLVPTSVLASQWAEEVKEFGLQPVLLSGMTPAARKAALLNVAGSLSAKPARTEVLITTMQLFTGDQGIKDAIQEMCSTATSVFIADEVHNFGAPSFASDPPEWFEFRIGLSATPVRQYDDEGTSFLFQYFNTDEDPAFVFTLGEAIASGCLTPYRYHLHPVEFTHEEMEKYSDLTEKLAKSGFMSDKGSTSGMTEWQEQLLRDRRGLVEQAVGKVEILRSLLSENPSEVSHTLIYCSAKAVKEPHVTKQIDQAREVLKALHITTHMLTAKESGTPLAQSVLAGLANGDYQTVLAMKVLDEGVDVPAARAAFLLSSTTVEREWVQRRGRVLRKAEGKTSADLHDFIVVPPDSGEPAARSLLASELRRAEHFTADAINAWDNGGPRDVIDNIEKSN